MEESMNLHLTELECHPPGGRKVSFNKTYVLQHELGQGLRSNSAHVRPFKLLLRPRHHVPEVKESGLSYG